MDQRFHRHSPTTPGPGGLTSPNPDHHARNDPKVIATTLGPSRGQAAQP
jgi:hypothetical protein